MNENLEKKNDLSGSEICRSGHDSSGSLGRNRFAVRSFLVLALGASGCTLDTMGEGVFGDEKSYDAGTDIFVEGQPETGGSAGTGGETESGAGAGGFAGTGGVAGTGGIDASAGTGGVDASAGTGGDGGPDGGEDVIEETAEADVQDDAVDSEAGDSGVLCDPADPNSITVVSDDECFKGAQYSIGGSAIVPEGSTPDSVACQTTPYCMKNMQPGSFGFLTVKNTLNGCITVHHVAQLKTPGLYGLCVNDYSAAPGPTQAEMKNKFMSGGYSALTVDSGANPVDLCFTCPQGTWMAYRLDVAP